MSWIRHRRDQMISSLIFLSCSQYGLVAARITSEESGNLTPFPKTFTLSWLYSHLHSLWAFLYLAERACRWVRSKLTSFSPAGLLTPTKQLANKFVPAISQFAAPRYFLVQVPLIFFASTGFKKLNNKVRFLARQGRIFLSVTALSADNVNSA
jgi:hypothetical protein